MAKKKSSTPSYGALPNVVSGSPGNPTYGAVPAPVAAPAQPLPNVVTGTPGNPTYGAVPVPVADTPQPLPNVITGAPGNPTYGAPPTPTGDNPNYGSLPNGSNNPDNPTYGAVPTRNRDNPHGDVLPNGSNNPDNPTYGATPIPTRDNPHGDVLPNVTNNPDNPTYGATPAVSNDSPGSEAGNQPMSELKGQPVHSVDHSPGNVGGAIVDVAQESGSSANTDGTYKIKHGDTLTSIAREHNISLPELEAANAGRFPNPNFILPGQEVHFPTGSTYPSATTDTSHSSVGADVTAGWAGGTDTQDISKTIIEESSKGKTEPPNKFGDQPNRSASA